MMKHQNTFSFKLIFAAVRKKLCFLLLFAAFLSFSFKAHAQYNAVLGDLAYEVTLWKNNDPKQVVKVSGSYSHLGNSESAEHEECSVSFSKELKEDGTHWKITVVPKKDYGVYNVSFPVLILPELENADLIHPRSFGERQKDIFNVKERFRRAGFWSGHRNENKECVWFGRYPETTLVLQMIVIENGKNALMIWAQDGETWMKDFILTRNDLPLNLRKKGLRFRAVHYPENTGQAGVAWKSPYPIVTTPFKGGWYEAARLYRNWALKQRWCAKGKIYDRPDTPEWFKNTQWCAAGNIWWGKRNLENGGYLELKKFQELAGGKNMISQLGQWSKYYAQMYTPDVMPSSHGKAFSRIIDALKKSGIHAAPYIFIYALDSSHYFYRFLKSRVAENEYHKETLYRYKPIDKYRNSPGGMYLYRDTLLYQDELRKAWKGPLNKRLVDKLDCFPMPEDYREKIKKLLVSKWGSKEIGLIDKIKFFEKRLFLCPGQPEVNGIYLRIADYLLGKHRTGAIYFDVYPTPAFPCYNPDHGHPLGYGPWFYKSVHELPQKILDKYPGTAIMSECMAEYMVDAISVWYGKFCHTGKIVPLFSTVYQGFTECSAYPALGLKRYKGWDKPEDFASYTARSMHLGYLPGGCFGIFYGLTDYPEDDCRTKFLQEALSIRNKYRDYIACGERLKDPEVKCSKFINAKSRSRYVGRGGISTVRFPAVQVSKWAKNKDFKKGIILISNASLEPQKIETAGKMMTIDAFSWKVIETENTPEKIMVPEKIPVEAYSGNDKNISRTETGRPEMSPTLSDTKLFRLDSSFFPPPMEKNINVFDFNKGFSLALWFKSGGVRKSQSIIFSNGRDPENSEGFALAIPEESKNLKLIRYFEECPAFAGTTSSEYNTVIKNAALPDKWTHVAVTVDPEKDKLQIYLNGDCLGIVENMKCKNINWNGKDDIICIGAENTLDKSSFFKGSISDLRLEQRIFAEEEIKALFNKKPQTL